MPRKIGDEEFYTAGETAQILGVHRLTLLRWIREKKVPDSARDRNGWRLFSSQDISHLRKMIETVEQPLGGQLRLFDRSGRTNYDEEPSNSLIVAETSKE